MSCTENESGPFVVFFVPAVVGCLTILLARRWKTSQVSNSTTTGVSRRRRILKDPLAKRPLPPITCKMLSQGNKKTATVAKKSAPTNGGEDDMSANAKRVGRPAKAPLPANMGSVPTETKSMEGPVTPKHIPFPLIPPDGELLFETMTFVFTSVAAGLQFLNLYRTVWWLPHSHNNQTMNFYLIDPHVVAFIITILSRRLLLSASMAVMRSLLVPKMWPHAATAARMFILGVVLGALAWCTYFILLKYPLVKIFYLCYPAVLYFILFGFQASPFLELSNNALVIHCCQSDPQAVRDEVDALRQDFNLRVKKILFGSILGAYYTSFIPCCFAQSFLYYDVRAACQQVALVWGGLFARLAAHLLSGKYCDVHHRAALHLGEWRLDRNVGPDIVVWNGSRVWKRGARVSVRGGVYACRSLCAAADPDMNEHRRFYMVFRNPSMFLCVLLCLHLSLILLQLCLLFSSVQWHTFMSLSILLFINYYTLFKLVRDYLVAWKVYKAEYMLQDKSACTPFT